MASLRMLQSFRTTTVATNVEVTVRDTVAAALGVSWDRLVPDTVLADDLAVDSLDLLTLGVAFEEALEIVLTPRTLGSVRTYGELVDAVQEAIASRDEASDGAVRAGHATHARALRPARHAPRGRPAVSIRKTTRKERP